jgi:hypothetical protein
MRAEWVTAIKAQCDKQGTLFFFKQWGGVRKATTGRLLHGRVYDAMPPRSSTPPPSRQVRERLVRESRILAAGWPATSLVTTAMIAPAPLPYFGTITDRIAVL